ncbi:hypothetical protein IAR50_001500 [Cryptococcus sp. DSM 104548]
MLVSPWIYRSRWYYNTVYPTYPVLPPIAPVATLAPITPVASVAPVGPVYPSTQPVSISQPIVQETVAYQDHQPSYSSTAVVVKPGSQGYRKTVSFSGVGSGNHHGQGHYGKSGGSYGHGYGHGHRNSYFGNGRRAASSWTAGK